jgi:hypothetical protein
MFESAWQVTLVSAQYDLADIRNQDRLLEDLSLQKLDFSNGLASENATFIGLLSNSWPGQNIALLEVDMDVAVRIGQLQDWN